MDWGVVDERLIRRGELLLSLDFLESYDLDLSVLNCGKVGRPYRVTYMYVVFLAVVRYLFGMPYRQLEGFTRALHRLIPRLPPVDYSWVRRRILRLDLRPYMSLSGYDGPVSIAVDSSGVRVCRCGGWVERVYGRRKRYIKIHFAVPCGLIPGLFRLSSLPFGDSCDVFGSRLRFPISFRLRAYCHASVPLP
jgi:hypothetical protein